MHRIIQVTFLSDWQVSSGIGDGHWADSMLARDGDGLPFLPGRAVKGALREAAHRLVGCRADLAEAESLFWGTRAAVGEETTAGILAVSAGRLEPVLREALLASDGADRDAFVRDLTCRRVQTALDADGQVVRGTLRKLECGIPGLVFEAELDVDVPKPMESWTLSYLRAVCAGVKSMGGGRARGLGRCRVLLDDGFEGLVFLPGTMPCGGRSASGTRDGEESRRIG